MKHAVIKVKNTEKSPSKASVNSIKIEPEIAKPKLAKQVKDNREKSERKLSISAASSNRNSKEKLLESVVVAFPKSKLTATKTASGISQKIDERKEDASVILPKQPKSKKSMSNVSAKSNATVAEIEVSRQTAERQSTANLTENVSAPRKKLLDKKKPHSGTTLNAISDVEIKNKNQKVNSTVSAVEAKPKKEKIVSSAAAQKIKQTEKPAKILPPVKAETAKNKSFVAINKISVIKKQVSLSDEKVNPILPLSSPKTVSIEPESVKSPAQKSKPKSKKPIGAAIFRGKKERYDFQVYSIDAEIENVSAIYIISRRKLDKQKRGHHALVCIGQTDSISGEIARHKNKCIKKHNANVISVLPEADEKKRSKIEEDLKAAHIIACGI